MKALDGCALWRSAPDRRSGNGSSCEDPDNDGVTHEISEGKLADSKNFDQIAANQFITLHLWDPRLGAVPPRWPRADPE